MNQEVKAKWLEALRSGKYPQTKQCLRSASGYCCLGVLCDIYDKERDPNNSQWVDKDDLFEFDHSQTLPSTAVKHWAGLDNYNPRIFVVQIGGITAHSLAGANDIGLDFNQIADIIEKEL